MTSIRESFNKEQADRLLTANNFFCEEDLWDILDYADDEAYDYIYANRNKYDSHIHYLLEPKDFIPPRVKMTVRNMTDKDMSDIAKEERTANIRKFEEVWKTMKDEIPERPHGDIDDEYDDAWDKLSSIRDRVTAYLSKKTGKYVAPGSRPKGDSALEKLEAELDECKNAYNDLEKRIEEADEKYLADKKNECFEEWLLQL